VERKPPSETFEFLIRRNRKYKEKQKMGTSNIADKVVVITGASSGVGESTAREEWDRMIDVNIKGRRLLTIEM
jgi:hypothetical protein